MVVYRLYSCWLVYNGQLVEHNNQSYHCLDGNDPWSQLSHHVTQSQYPEVEDDQWDREHDADNLKVHFWDGEAHEHRDIVPRQHKEVNDIPWP